MNTIENSEKKKSSELIKRTSINNTPFILIEMEDKEDSFITFGRYKMTDNIYKDLKSITIDRYIQKNLFDLIITLITIINDVNNKNK